MMTSQEERLILTGMLGDVMRESAQAAVSYVRSNLRLARRGPCHPRKQDGAHPRPGRRHPQGRSVGRRHHGHGRGVAGHRAAGARRPGDDGRDHAPRARCYPSAASRRRCWPPTAPASASWPCHGATRLTSRTCPPKSARICASSPSKKPRRCSRRPWSRRRQSRGRARSCPVWPRPGVAPFQPYATP